MKLKKVAITLVGIGGTILTGILLKKGGASNTTKVVQGIVSEPEQYFHGVPLSKLTDL